MNNPMERISLSASTFATSIFTPTGPREVLFKVYDPDGQPVVREVIPDDGCASANMPDGLAAGITSCNASSTILPRAPRLRSLGRMVRSGRL